LETTAVYALFRGLDKIGYVILSQVPNLY